MRQEISAGSLPLDTICHDMRAECAALHRKSTIPSRAQTLWFGCVWAWIPFRIFCEVSESDSDSLHQSTSVDCDKVFFVANGLWQSIRFSILELFTAESTHFLTKCSFFASFSIIPCLYPLLLYLSQRNYHLRYPSSSYNRRWVSIAFVAARVKINRLSQVSIPKRLRRYKVHVQTIFERRKSG